MTQPAKIIPLHQARQWHAAKLSSQHADWNVASRPVDVDLRHGLGLLRARARELYQNSDHARGFIRIVRNNVVGAPGFVLQSRATLARGKPDVRLRNAIEAEWTAWGQRGVCEASGKFSWRQLQRHLIETVARDGEAFVRILRSGFNRYQFALQVIDPEAVDIQFNGEHEGREIRMGVELDAWRAPVAYWLNAEPRLYQSSYRLGERYRVPAAEMLHLYLPEFFWQTRGVPWMATAASRLHLIQGTEDAEVTASRASAAKFAAYEAKEFAPPPPAPTSGALVGADGQPLSSDPGRFTQDLAPGSMEIVPWGYELKLLDPQHPNAAMPEFLKWGLRSVATGLGVSYNTLGNDAEGVNYTSLRFFLGVERDHWMEAQDWFETEFPARVFSAWMDHQIPLGTFGPGEVQPARAAQMHAVQWQPRRWEGPDPAKQAQADETELANGTTTLHDIAARKGRDLDDLIEQRIAELTTIKTKAEAAGLTLADILPALASARPAPVSTPNAQDDPP
jgi:lambda family phage portal protein